MTAKNKKILFIITQSEMGGAQRFLFNFLSRISSRYEIMVAYGADGGEELDEKLKNIGISTLRLKFLKRDINPVNDIKAVYEIKNLLNEFRPDDLFLLSSKAGFIGALASSYLPDVRQPRVIYRIGGWTFNDPWPTWKRKLWIKLEKLGARWKDMIIVNNDHDLKQAHRLGIKPKEKIVLIHNGIDPYKLEPLNRDEARLKIFEKLSKISAKVFQTETIVGTVANLYPPKGIKFLVDTAEYFRNQPDIIFVVIGDGQERQEIEQKIKEKGLEKKIFLLGKMKDGHKLMPAFDIFVLPSVKEGFPFAILEAMAAKLPVIATRVGAVPEMIENGKNGFVVEPGNPPALAAKIKELLASDYLQKEFSIQGHQTLLFNFSEDKMVKDIEALL